MNSGVAIVVHSCDKYSDLWSAFFETLQIRWSNCPYPIYLVTNHLNFTHKNVTTVQIGEDRTWSENLAAALASVPYPYVLLMLEDLFLKTHVDNERVTALIDTCVVQQWDYLRLNPTPGPPASTGTQGGVGPIPAGDWYRSATVMSVWRRDVLLNVLDPKENAWEFEIHGSSRTDQYPRWFASVDWNLPFLNVVIKGKIDPVALRNLRAINVTLQSTRPQLDLLDRGRLSLGRFRSNLMNLVPRRLRRAVRNRFAARQ